MFRSIRVFCLLTCLVSIAQAGPEPFSGVLPSINAYLGYHFLEEPDRKSLLHPLFELRYLDENGRQQQESRSDTVGMPIIASYKGSLVALEQISTHLLSASLHYANEERAWLLLVEEDDKWTVISAQHVAARENEGDGLFDLGKRTDIVREIVGKFYLYSATGNLKSLRKLLGTGWLEIYQAEPGRQWQTRDRNDYLGYVDNRDGISRIAAGKRIVSIDFIHHQVARVTVQADRQRRELLFLVADDDTWQITYYVH